MAKQQERNQLARVDASVLMQIGTTIAAIAVALATLAKGDGPTFGDDFQIMPASFLLVGLASIYGSLGAMAAIGSEAGMTFYDDILGGNAEAHEDVGPDAYRALVVITWALWFLAIVHVVQLFTTAF